MEHTGQRIKIMAYAHDIRLIRIGLADRFVATLKSYSESVARYRLYRKTVSELSALSIRELEDLGLSRSSIRSAAYDATYGMRA